MPPKIDIELQIRSGAGIRLAHVERDNHFLNSTFHFSALIEALELWQSSGKEILRQSRLIDQIRAFNSAMEE